MEWVIALGVGFALFLIKQSNRLKRTKGIALEDDLAHYREVCNRAEADCRKNAHSPSGVSRLMRPKYEHPYYKKHIKNKRDLNTQLNAQESPFLLNPQQHIVDYYTENVQYFSRDNKENNYQKCCVINAKKQGNSNVREDEYTDMAERFELQRKFTPQFTPLINQTEALCMQALIRNTKGIRRCLAVPARFGFKDSTGQLLKSSEYINEVSGFYMWSTKEKVNTHSIERHLEEITKFVGFSGIILSISLENEKILLHHSSVK
ncbi:hypothetical protein [Pseudoalteromonas luteoviolacea]|uniref:Uncharacterized protein n=1 Tax=Pseudoalteromonas luteoviolacea S4054 TaxID=1129367 RepID=A0A0F6AAZ0_9GAMM|nr:hypothetical protein [Pseudoalteromonas luteoviolacea]AOT06842.1 hypothetical protein S4054249_02660 [Pseudoalteromonas luteoviolacea]AOT11760.1 hypothetical protein S40542_02660 [Pseudoalteromonas luteoviolacea]AOT16672.1 hypothetical protein S4054_02660 [Pseudoalteromonas luteoviolacea]KKE83335.1 hypothetical protein N479_14425 [Pseudoalteromonas luteoviolacea S4054]KZN74048.1 hypothetical protein N481_10060 [Pseudoalteromonas luteoviolacea S4047-1]